MSNRPLQSTVSCDKKTNNTNLFSALRRRPNLSSSAAFWANYIYIAQIKYHLQKMRYTRGGRQRGKVITNHVLYRRYEISKRLSRRSMDGVDFSLLARDAQDIYRRTSATFVTNLSWESTLSIEKKLTCRAQSPLDVADCI